MSRSFDIKLDKISEFTKRLIFARNSYYNRSLLKVSASDSLTLRA